MRVELKYFSGIIFLFAASVLLLTLLFKKYSVYTLGSFIDTCEKIVNSFFSTQAQFIGFSIIGLVVIASTIFSLKSLFSLFKTQKKLERLLKMSTDKFPKKLERILVKNKLNESQLVVLLCKQDYATTVGTFSPKIMVSSGLIEKLTEAELESVVLHETYHRKNWHGLLIIIAEIVSSTLFFLPIASELLKKMRVAIERQADLFVIKSQSGVKNLNLAISKVSIRQDLFYYPSFSQRKDMAFKKGSVVFSILVFLMGIYLYLLPTQTVAQSGPFELGAGECGQNQCSTGCAGQGEFILQSKLTT